MWVVRKLKLLFGGFGGFGFFGFGGVLGAVEAVHGFDDDEDSESDNEEIDDVLDEIAIGDVGDGVGAKDIRNINRERGKVKTAGEQTSDRHDNVVDEGFDNGSESAADGNTDGEIHDATAVDKFFKFANKRALGEGFDRMKASSVLFSFVSFFTHSYIIA